MIEITNVKTFGWESAVRGMRNPLNSWELSDSGYDWGEMANGSDWEFYVGNNDLDLMKKLVSAGSDHSKFMRMINVSMDIKSPLYWWKEYDTYKIGTVANSCSTMHKIASKEFTLDDFSTEHLHGLYLKEVERVVVLLNDAREEFLKSKNKDDWWQMIQLLPSSYNQLRTVQLNYAVLRNMYHARKNHKLDEWKTFCAEIEKLPYSFLITM